MPRTALTPELLAASSDAIGRIWIACLWLMGAVVLLGLGVWYYRKYWLDPPTTDSTSAWTLDDLRKLHECGELSTEEYQRLRSVMIGSVKEKADAPPRTPPHRKNVEPWDWVAGQDEPGGDFDLKKRPRG